MSENIADPSDLASKHEELFLGLALRKRQPEGPAATGFCLWCGEPVNADMRWCSADCRDDHQKFSK